MTMDLRSASAYSEKGIVQYEMYVQCRHCDKTAIWHAAPKPNKHPPTALIGETDVINDSLIIYGVVRPGASTVKAPEHTPANLVKIFDEGAECFAISCWNASGSMFRKIVDEISKGLLICPL